MENKCNCCGQCCRKIHLPLGVHTELQTNPNLKGDYKFIQENWECLGQSLEVGGFGLKHIHGTFVYPYVYRCKLISEDNLCTIHKEKPNVCSEYPWYGNGKSNRSVPWPYVGCGYERDCQELSLIKVLDLFIDKKYGGRVETKRKES